MIAAALFICVLLQDSSKVKGRDSIKANEIVRIVDAVADYVVSAEATRPVGKKSTSEIPLIIDMRSVADGFRPVADGDSVVGKPKRMLRDDKLKDAAKCARTHKPCAVSGVTQVLRVESVARTGVAGIYKVLVTVGYIEPTGSGPRGFYRAEYFVQREPKGWTVRPGRLAAVD